MSFHARADAGAGGIVIPGRGLRGEAVDALPAAVWRADALAAAAEPTLSTGLPALTVERNYQQLTQMERARLSLQALGWCRLPPGQSESWRAGDTGARLWCKDAALDLGLTA